MGWFDNEQEDGRPAGAAPQAAPVAPRPVAKSPAPGAEAGSGSGSTLGREIHIDGTIVCDEDLTILGRVVGTIRAKGTLVIAKEADVRAKIDGQRVMVHGKVDGNVQGAELVVVGQTGRLNGNIETPALEIIEGARFKGSVEMQAPKPQPVSKPAPVAASKPKEDSSKAAGSAGAGPGPGPGPGPGAKPKASTADSAEDTAPAQKHATS